MRLTDIKFLKVIYRGRLVGLIFPYEDHTDFQYDKDWIANGFSVSPIKLPLKNGIFHSDKKYFGYLDGSFYDCLPDSWGNRLVDKWLLDNGYDPRYTSLFERLSLLGETSLGGLDFEPSCKICSDDDLDFDTLLDSCRSIERNEPINQAAFSNLYSHSSSVGGSRPKVFVKIDGEDWILKFPSNRDPEWQSIMEYDYNVAANACGLNVPPFRLMTTDKGIQLFATKRFDRDKGKKVHVISLAGLTEVNIDYPQLDYLSFLQATGFLCKNDMEQALKLMIFNIKARNRDDHARNISFYWNEEEKHYRLSPAYDLTYTPGIKEHALSCNWIGNPNDDDIVEVAKKVGFREKCVRDKISEIEKLTAPLEKYWGKYE